MRPRPLYSGQVDEGLRLQMMTCEVRRARLDDTAAISELLCSRIERWQRFTAAGAVEDCRYEDLRIAERWLHGGAWMSVETGAIHLSRLLTGAGLSLVAERKGRVVGYLEAFRSQENEPFGRHWGISYLLGRGEKTNSRQSEQALLEYLRDYAKRELPARVLITGTQPVEEAWYEANGFARVARARRFRMTAEGGRVFFRASAHPNEDPAQIDGWEMAIGRESSSRCQWERDWRQLWDALVEQGERRVDRFRLALAGHQALVCARQGAYHRQSVEIALWSMKPLSVQLMIALREWAFRQKYRELLLLIHEKDVSLLADSAEADGYYLDTYALNLEEATSE